MPSETKLVSTSSYCVQFFFDYFNERIRIDHYRGNMTMVLQEIDRLCEEATFQKVIIFSRPEYWRDLFSRGYELEAVISGYFNGTDNFIMARYLDDNRRTSKHWVNEDRILEKVCKKDREVNKVIIPSHYQFRKAEIEDAEQLAKLYGKVFEIYPTPMNDKEYVEKLLKDGNLFYVVESNGLIVSAASADINETFHNAELTDCATLQDHRKYGLMKKLLLFLEKDLRKKRIFCTFSIARSLSFGMNAAFFQLGYKYNGRLLNNCYIYDKLEDMNVWVKDLSS